MNAKSVGAIVVALSIVCCCVSCGSETRKRSFRQINADRQNLPILLLTQETRKDLIVPGNTVPPIVDEETGELCWQAYHCTNPGCPGNGKLEDGRPLLFIHADPLVKVGPDGNIVRVEVPAGKDAGEYMVELGGTMYPTCPECLKIRDCENEMQEERLKYVNWVQPFVLPEVAQRIKELDEEEAKRREDLERRKDRPVPD